MTTSDDDIDEVALAERQVAMRKAELARSLRHAERSSEQLAERLTSELKPTLIATAAVVGAAAVAGIGVALLRRRRARRAWMPPQPPSMFGNLAQGAGLWLARIAARRVAEQVTRRLLAHAAHATTSVASSPNQI